MEGNLSSVLTGSYSPLYASPQQMRGDKADPRDDVYALGVIWYQLLKANLSSPAPTGRKWIDVLRSRGISDATVDLLSSCFEGDPDDRPADAGVLAEQLRVLSTSTTTKSADAAIELIDVEPAPPRFPSLSSPPTKTEPQLAPRTVPERTLLPQKNQTEPRPAAVEGRFPQTSMVEPKPVLAAEPTLNLTREELDADAIPVVPTPSGQPERAARTRTRPETLPDQDRPPNFASPRRNIDEEPASPAQQTQMADQSPRPTNPQALPQRVNGSKHSAVSPVRNIIGIVLLVAFCVVGWSQHSAKDGYNTAVMALNARAQDPEKDLMTVSEAEELMGKKQPDSPGTVAQEDLLTFTKRTYTWKGSLRSYTVTAYYSKGEVPRLDHFETDTAEEERTGTHPEEKTGAHLDSSPSAPPPNTPPPF
jgi:hypothetical protein